MAFWEWLTTRDWAATGGMLTALFTGATGWMVWRNRPTARMRIELESMVEALDRGTVSLVFTFRNEGTGAAYGARLFATAPGVPDKQMGATIACIPSGEAVRLERSRSTISGPVKLDEATGQYPRPADGEVYDPRSFGVAITWHQPPRHRRTRGQRALESQLLAEYLARRDPLAKR